jgi:hypothetical protein
MNAERISKMLEDLSCNECKQYCFYKELLKSVHFSPKTLIQLKCIEKFKYEQSEQEGFDIGFTEAGIRWSEKGYAKKFSDIYNEELNFQEIYKKTTQK